METHRKAEKITTDKFHELLTWIADKEEGDFIETRDYHESYLGFPEVTQNELDAMCHVFNKFFNSDFVITNDKGKIIATRKDG